MARSRRRKIGEKVTLVGSNYAPKMVVEDVYARVRGTGCYDRHTVNGVKYFRWRGPVEDAKGVRKPRSVYSAKSQADLERRVKALLASPGCGDTKRLTIESYLENTFLPGIKERVRYSTYATYKTACEQYLSKIGSVKLAALTLRNVDAWLTDLKVGPSAKRLALATLKRSYSYAVELGMFERNPIIGVRPVRVPRVEPRILSLEELRKLLDVARGTVWYPLLYVALACSVRPGELFGLRVSDVNLAEAYIHIAKALALVDRGTYALAEPKTKASRRRIDLPKRAVTLLRDHLERNGSNPHGLVFTSPNGSPIDSSNFLKRGLRPLLEKAELPPVTTQSLRHAGNSALSADGTSVKALQSRLGHETSKTTIDVYTHVAPSEGRAAADRIGVLLDGKVDKKMDKRSRVRSQDKKPGKQKSLTS